MFEFRNFVVIGIFFCLQGCENMDKNMDSELIGGKIIAEYPPCLLYTSPSPRDRTRSRMPSSA